MPDITVADALAALIEDLRGSASGKPADGVEVELSLVALEERRGVRWSVAAAGDTGTHRVRLTVYPWQEQRQPASSGPRPGGLDEIPTGIDPARVGSTHLPPIVRPKPGIDMDRDGE